MAPRRIKTVRSRAADVLDALEAHGPCSLSVISQATGYAMHLTRYALRTLCEDEKAHVVSFDRITCHDGIPRYVATYCYGPGMNARRPDSLDFETGSDLQPIFLLWGATREPIILEDE